MEIRPAVKDMLGTRVELRMGDPMDSDIGRKFAELVPVGRPGRGMSPERLHILIGLPRLDSSSDVEDLPAGVADACEAVRQLYGDRAGAAGADAAAQCRPRRGRRRRPRGGRAGQGQGSPSASAKPNWRR